MGMDGDLMAYLEFKGLKEYELKLSRLEANTEKTVGEAIYQGAKIVADEIKSGIETLNVEKSRKGNKQNLLSGITQDQKEGLKNGFGIAPMEYENGYRSVKLGFDGYNNTKTKKYPKGQPNVLIARAVESGTSFRKKTPFVRPAIKRTKTKAEQAMTKIIEEQISKDMKG